MGKSMRWGLAVMALSLFGCDTPETLSCGPGTVQSGDQCVADPGTTMMMMDPPSPPSMMDPPPPMDPPPGTDGGPGWGTTDPMAPPGEPGCDAAEGECGEWADELVAMLAANPGRGCEAPLTRPEGMQTIAQRHAAHQASIDMLDASSPDGNLFEQIRDSGVTFMFGGALFSVGRTGAGDVMGRWADGSDTAAVLDQCWTMTGVSFATGESGWSYATVLLAR